jgi:mycothiol system anti-sigma-R factor
MPDGSGRDGFHVPPPTTNSTEMSPCDENSVKMLRYLDGDLEGRELEEFRSHLDSCSNCLAHLEKEKALSHLLRRSRPLYSAPASLRARVSAATEASASISTSTDSTSSDQFDRRILQTTGGAWSRFPRMRVLAPAAIAIALCLALVPDIVRNVRAADYVETAVAEHRSYLNGSLSTGLASNSPQQVTAWFAGKVPFDFRLPAVESTPEGRPAYRLTGASVVNYKGSPAALVMYETRSEKISLLVDSSKVAIVAGGDEVRLDKLIFHYRNESGFRVITWANHGLSYALVSSVSGLARESCLVCHQNMADRDNFKVRQ